ncbi:uncharacterized protein LOC116345463 isoform X2 [Contarinia nasturtii]|uniref:uncharacterized protein LOC116345463 isoform X2 n=1 Tax=Contarinia nasturtii TaxID=265458 RepID=UPI0012D3DB3E|nr:uncharacterized protein LOC116345463 isoform X2 [Contarinia nasturtii]
MKSASKMTSLHNEHSYDLIHTDCHHTTTTTTASTTAAHHEHRHRQHQEHHYHHRSINHRRNDVQTHSISTAKHSKCASHDKSVVKCGRTLDKSSDFFRWHKTKLKTAYRWQMTKRYILVITIVLFASLSDILICVAHAGDVTSLIRVSDDDRSNNQKFAADLAITTDPLTRDSGMAASSASNRNHPGLYNLDRIGSNLEMSIAAVFNKVAYGTTTKRSISDNVFVPNLTTVPTPQLTTFRYREKEKEFDPKQQQPHHQYQQHLSYQKHANFNNKYSLDLEHDHVLPTSAPNADILKSNSNPTYPNPNRHHNHGHRAHLNSTPSPAAPRVPPEYPQNPFAEQPTLRGTNSESGIVSGFNINRRPIPPPSLMPGHEKIPYLPPDLNPNNNNNNNNNNIGNEPKNKALVTDPERKKVLNTPAQKLNLNRINSNQAALNSTNYSASKPAGIHFPSFSRILSGVDGGIPYTPDNILKGVTSRPTEVQSEMPTRESGAEKAVSEKPAEIDGDDNTDEDTSPEEDFDSTTFNGEGPKTQPKIKQGTTITGQKSATTKKSVITESPAQSDMVYSTQIIQNLEATNTEKKVKQITVLGNSKITNERSTLNTWTVAWNIHVYLSAILFTILAVYSIFKMIFYDKLTHLVNQSYFICLHLLLIIICLARIFFLCYDAYNIHLSFHMFISELLLNLPATFLTISFSVLILFLLLRSLNHKNNRYSALMRPLTVVVGSSVHVFLCVTLHYVESYGQQRNQQIQQQLLLRNGDGYRGNQNYVYQPPPRVLSLICQLIYIFICLSLGFFYLYIYKVLKRVLQKKSQNYIHGYQNLSYAIHITIATALLFILLAALQIYGAISISTTRPIVSSLSDNDWLQWGYQFSLRLIEIAIIALLSWVTGLKTGTTKVMQRDKVMEQHNVSGFALFPCTSSSSQEHFETDYPAICNANTNLHSYTLRTGKPIYDDTFALNSLGMENPVPMVGGNTQIQQHHHHHHPSHLNTVGKNNQYSKNGQEYQLSGPPTLTNESGIYEGQMGTLSKQNNRTTPTYPDPRDSRGSENLNDSGTIPDHYENPNFELHSNSNSNYRKQQHQQAYIDQCYTEPINAEMMYNSKDVPSNYDFQNFERPNYTERNLLPGSSATEFRASKNLKALVKSNSGNYDPQNQQLKQNNLSVGGGKSSHYNPQTHSYNSFDRRGQRKSGTRTLNAVRSSQYQHDYHPNGQWQRTSAGRSSNNSGTSKERSHHNFLATTATMANDNSIVDNNIDAAANEFDTVSNASSSDGVRAVNYNPDMVLFKAQRDHQIDANAQNSASSGDSSTSMLVAEHGFVRFRPMENIAKDKKPETKPSNSDNNNKNSPAIMQRHHKRSLTNS